MESAIDSIRIMQTIPEDLIRDCDIYSQNIYKRVEFFNQFRILEENTKNKVFAPIWICFRKNNDLFIVIRSSNSKHDVITDVTSKEVKKGGVSFHLGFYLSAAVIFSRIKEIMKCHEGRIIITGHSLGGSVATALCVIAKQDAQLKNKSIRAICFGPAPSIGNCPQNIRRNIISFVNNNDIVPTLCTKNITKFFLNGYYFVNYINYKISTRKILSLLLNKEILEVFDGIYSNYSHSADIAVSFINFNIKSLEGVVLHIDESCEVIIPNEERLENLWLKGNWGDDHRIRNYKISIFNNLRDELSN